MSILTSRGGGSSSVRRLVWLSLGSNSRRRRAVRQAGKVRESTSSRHFSGGRGSLRAGIPERRGAVRKVGDARRDPPEADYVGVVLFEQEFRRGACGATESAFLAPFVRYVYIPRPSLENTHAQLKRCSKRATPFSGKHTYIGRRWKTDTPRPERRARSATPASAVDGKAARTREATLDESRSPDVRPKRPSRRR